MLDSEGGEIDLKQNIDSDEGVTLHRYPLHHRDDVDVSFDEDDDALDDDEDLNDEDFDEDADDVFDAGDEEEEEDDADEDIDFNAFFNEINPTINDAGFSSGFVPDDEI